MSRLVVNWPDEAGEAVHAARGRLELAGESLAQRSFEERLASVAAVIEAWSAPDSPWRRELCTLLASQSSFHPRTIEEGLESALRAWQSTRFIECARREIELGGESGRLRLAPYRTTSVLAGGSIPMPTLLAALLPLVLGSPVLLRETTKDPVTAPLLVRSLAAHDADLARCLEVVRFPVEDDPALGAFLESPCVVATGSDETISTIRARLGADQRFVGYGHKFSIAILGPDLGGDEAELDRIAEGLALDVSRWDQLGCLSPVVVYLVGTSLSVRQDIAQRISSNLDQCTESMPRGTYPKDLLAGFSTERAEAQMRAAVDVDTFLLGGNDFAVALEADARPRPAPLLRFLRLAPVATLADLAQELSAFSSHLSTAAVAGFSHPQSQQLETLLTHSGVSRITMPGRLQTPPIDWPHDGMPVFLPMSRFVQCD